jgi:hypothetical protein
MKQLKLILTTSTHLLIPAATSTSCRWLDEQKKLANVTPDSPV